MPINRSVSGPRLTLSTACLSGSLSDKLQAASTVGFSNIELLQHDLLLATSSPREVRSEIAHLGMSLVAFQPLHVETLPPDLFPRLVRRAERAIELVEELRADVLVLCSSRSADGVDDDALAAEQLSELAERAASHGVRLAYEAIPWGRVADHEHAARLVQSADHPALGLCLDSFHVLSSDNDPTAIRDIPVSKVFHVQLADGPRLNMTDRAVSLHQRMFPGDGALDVVGFVRELVAGGYDGPMALEVFNDVYQQEDPHYAATGAMRSVATFAEACAVDERASAPRLFNMVLPPAPPVDGFAFVELGVDEVSAPVIAHALKGLGFVHTGQHRSKPVELWQQGNIRLLLNHSPHRSVDPASATICALAVESADTEGFEARARHLRAPQLPRLRQPDETALTSVAAPDGTAVFFCDSEREHSWLEDFASTGAETPDFSRLLTIDHVSLTESIDDFDQTALFYRGVLGLASAETAEVMAPFGLVRRWSATDTSQRLRISLSTAPLRRGDWAPAVSNPQHIAFTTDDAVECARALKPTAVSVLPMPANYYDDLESRTALPPELLAAMREHSILYDSDRHGEYLHFFTTIVGSRVFFEVVQRIGGYASVGSPTSTALRMAAHRRHRLRVVSGAPTGPDKTTGAEPRRDYSLAHLTALSLSPPELVDAAAAAGYRYVGLRLTRVTMQEPYYPLAHDPALMRATKTHLAATGVKVLDVELARLSSGDSPRDYLRFLETAAELGAKHVITQLPDSDFSRKTDKFAELCQLARTYRLTVDLEFPSWTETPSLHEAVRVLRAADQSNAGLLVDLLHFARSRSRVDELRELPAEWFHFVHVCDAPGEIPGTTEELIHTARFERLFPGEGEIDMHAILAALPSGLPYALEIPKAKMTAQVGGKEHARMALRAARHHLEVTKEAARGS